jgi:hypothetical protein
VQSARPLLGSPLLKMDQNEVLFRRCHLSPSQQTLSSFYAVNAVLARLAWLGRRDHNGP